ncbi:Central kinetochore-associated [Teratosphaeria destructans]|uniref:Central kinetochore-associated n=1 Tax=Teratosphaeria destructans TaxID=418781 RepID=A0A9W7T019_9PEZI|nr:Central kinetochore-associated [Teratosphaeria destructans]
MESPSMVPLPQVDASMLDLHGPPSSPFVTEVEGPSRNPSKQWMPETDNKIKEDTDLLGSPLKAPAGMDVEDKGNIPQEPTSTLSKVFASPQDNGEDKENIVHDEPTATLKKVFASPQKHSTPERIPLKPGTPEPSKDGRRGSTDSDLMPPPSTTRNPHTTPKRTPLRSSKSCSNTPKTLTRHNSHDRPTATGQTPSAFQAGLDLRNSAVPPQSAASIDDTCYSTFSEVPEMTLFAKLGQSPTKRGDLSATPAGAVSNYTTPRTTRKRSSPSRSPSPTPRRHKAHTMQSQDGTTSFLIDFTQQMESVGGYRQGSPPKSTTEPNLLQHLNSQRSPHKGSRPNYSTPSKPNNILNLLDFELPPAPTPRSVPTITVRELESLKSSYLSQISSLKATLSGREAEVESLKRAVGDAERRVGEAQEALREEKCRREHVEQEKAGWERRGQEVENVLKNVKEEVLKSEAEKEDLLRKMEDTEHRVEEAEARAAKAEERFADALAARAEGGSSDANAVEEQVQRLFNAQIDSKIEQVSRELHAVYKEKHERKVATLKKSYEARSEKKCADLQARLADVERQNDDLLAAKDATFSGPVADANVEAELKAQIEEQRAALHRLQQEMYTSRQQQDQLMRELQQERIEKGDLVAAVDEMLLLQSEAGPTQGAMSVVEDFRKSIGRPTGLKPPGAAGGVSRFGGPAGHGRSGSSGKSRMLANIERMGRQGGGGGAFE